MKKIKLIVLILFITILFSAVHAQQKSYTTQITVKTKMNYLLYIPQEKSELMPLLVFLHGGGESGDDIEKVKKHGSPKLIEAGKEFPFYVLSPQNPYEKGFWDDRVIYNLMQKIIHENSIDTNRIYLVGLSRGGYGAWRLAMNNPDVFAAMAVICAASAPENYTGWVKNIPVWIFHGKKDETVPFSESVDMAMALEKEGADVKLTLYPEAGHDAWTQTFENEEFFDWLLKHRKKNKNINE